MKDEGSRPTLRSYLQTSGVPPEKFLEALRILADEARALLEEARPAEAAPAAPRSDESENDAIRRILEEIKSRWVQQDRQRARAESRHAAPPAPEAPPAAPPDAGAGRITTETVILKGPAGATRPPAPAAAPPPPLPEDDQPTTFLKIDRPAQPPVAAAPEAPESAAEEPLLETVVRPSRQAHAPDDPPTTFLKSGKPPQPPAAPPPDAAPLPPAEDDMAKTIILRPDQLKPKGKGGPR